MSIEVTTLSEAEKKVKMRLLMFNPVKDNHPYCKDYVVPFSQGLTVLMALNNIE